MWPIRVTAPRVTFETTGKGIERLTKWTERIRPNLNVSSTGTGSKTSVSRYESNGEANELTDAPIDFCPRRILAGASFNGAPKSRRESDDYSRRCLRLLIINCERMQILTKRRAGNATQC